MWVEADRVDQNIERPFTNFDLAVLVGGLTDLVKSHDDDGGSVLLDRVGLHDEVLFALLQGDGIDDTLALTTLQTGLDYFEVGRVLWGKFNTKMG